MSSDLRHQLGALGERLAAEHLNRLGLAVIERNYRTRWGELDLIAYDGATTLVFCEVKTRRATAAGAVPLEAVHTRKRSQVRRMAASWLAERTGRPYADVLRFDAIGIVMDGQDRLVSLEHVEAAF